MGVCKYHDCVHSPNILNSFTKQCERLGIKVNKGDCPIRLIMENKNKIQVLEPSYQIFNKPATEVPWPRNIDLLITKFPATEKDGFTKGLAGYIANQAFNHMNANSLAYILASSFKEEKMRPFSLVDIFISAGFKFLDTIVLIKNKFIPTQGSKRLNNVYSFNFMFSKGDNYHLDRSSISYLKNSVNPDIKESDGDEYKCPGNAWRITVDDKDATPIELVDCLIKLSNILPNSLIVDPFMNNGAVLKSAIGNNHSFWGCEADAALFKQCKHLIK